MDRYHDCLKHMSDLRDLVSSIKKAGRREEVDEYDKKAKLLVQKIIIKSPYMIKEIHDEAIRQQTKITQADAKAILG